MDDKENRDKIIAEAIERDKLQKQGTKGEELYALNDQAAYTGMGKVDVPEWADYDLGTNLVQAGRACDQVVRERTEEAGRKLQGLQGPMPLVGNPMATSVQIPM